MPTPAERQWAPGGCECPEPQGAGDATLAHIIHLYRCERWSTYRIAAGAGISHQRVARTLRRAGVALRPRGAGGTRPDRRVAQPGNLEELLRAWYLDARMTSAQIGEKLGMSERLVRTRLAEYGIARRHRGQLHREDRHRLDRGVLDHWYTDVRLSAAAVGTVTGTSRSIVLRNAHDLGVPVRLGGAPPRRGPSEIALIDALYADALVAAVVAQHGLPVVPAGGAVWQRFPDPVPLTPALVHDLYHEAGVSVHHVELLTGQPAITVTRFLHASAVPLRPRGGRCPFLRRWRASLAGGARPDRAGSG